MCSALLEFLNEDRWAEVNEGTEIHIYVTAFPNLTKSRIVNVYCCRLLLTNRHSVCHVQRLTVQILCKLHRMQLNCTLQ